MKRFSMAMLFEIQYILQFKIRSSRALNLSVKIFLLLNFVLKKIDF